MPKYLVTKCLQWDELSPEQRAKIIDKNRDIRLEILSSEEIIWEFSEAGNMIADAGFLNPEIYYVYDHCQGQGACFDCEIFNWELLLEDLDIPHKQFFINYLKDGSNIEYGIRYPAASFAWRYYHERCRIFYIESRHGWSRRVCQVFDKIERHIEAKRLNLSQEAFSAIRKAIDWLQSDECVAEEFAYTDYYFNEETLCVVDETRLVDIAGEELDESPVKEENNA